MKTLSSASGRRLPGPFALLLLSLAPVALGGSCAASIESGPTGTGGSTGGTGGAGGQDSVTASASTSTASASTASSSTTTTGSGPTSCTVAADCAGQNDVCNVGSCVNGTCEKMPANDFGSCDDGKFCTENDICQSGVCGGGSVKFCAAMDTCHVGVCDENLKACSNVSGNDGAQCDDMNACTVQGVCAAGVCSQGQPIDCTIYDGECSMGVCMAGQGCVKMNTNELGVCNNGDVNGCSQGQCQMGNCASIPKNDGQPCDDTKYCTINDHCQGGACNGDPNPCAPPSNPCQIGVCNEQFQNCSVSNAANGTACSDGNLCTGGETCQAGQCVGGQPANNGVACDDGNGCTNGTSCAAGVCGNPTSQILACMSGDNCCPAGCMLNSDADCLYYVPGVQQNVPEATLQGWSQCFKGTYADSSPTVAQLLSQCSKSKLLMACRQVGLPNWKLLAMAPRADVLFDCGQQNNCTKQSNGVGWYFNDSYSWGFAPGGQDVNRNSCDYNPGNMQLLPDQRLCWHTGGQSINTGYRCGDNSLNNDSTWERAVYQAD